MDVLFRSLNNKSIDCMNIVERIIYNDKRSCFKELLVKDNSVSEHHNNIHNLAIEMYKVANSMSPHIMIYVFKLRDEAHYHLRHTAQFLVDPIHSIYNSTEPFSYLGPKIWEQIPTEIKNKDSLVRCKKEIRKWKPLNCPCRIFKIFIANLGFI